MIFPPHLKEIDVMAKWVKDAIETHQGVSTSLIDINLLMLSTPPSFIALSYKKLKAYKNHFRVDDEQINLLFTYDFGVAQGNEDNVLGQIQYVGTLNQIYN
jgi:hypothetical protein